MNNLSKRNPIVAGILSLFLGPFGYLYIGLNFFFAALIISVLFIIVLNLVNLPFPYFFNYFQLLIYAYYGYNLAKTRNIVSDNYDTTYDEIKEFKSFGLGFVIMTNLLMTLTQFYAIIVGLALAYQNFANGKIFMGIVIILFGIWLLMWLLSSIFAVITGLLMMTFKIDKKYF